MRQYQTIKNIGGGFCLEFFNAVENFIDAIKNKDLDAVSDSFTTLDNWGLEKHKQIEIMNYALNVSTVGISITQVHNIITGDYNSNL